MITRLVDLLPVVRSAVYFPEFDFSNSIKSVAPALCPDFSYDDLDEIADGSAAAAAYLQLATGAVANVDTAQQLRVALTRSQWLECIRRSRSYPPEHIESF